MGTKGDMRMTKKLFHKTCGNEVSTAPDDISDGYFVACVHCDEDLFSFETIGEHEND